MHLVAEVFRGFWCLCALWFGGWTFIVFADMARDAFRDPCFNLKERE